MPRFIRNLGASLASLRDQRTRALLSSLGIMVGSLAILLLVSIGKGVQQDVGREVEGLGVNLLIVLPGRIEEGSMFAPGLLGISYLEEQDVERIKLVPGVREAVPISFVGSGLEAGGHRSPTTLVVATRPHWFDIRKSKYRSGRGFLPEEAAAQVCVLGSVAADKLFPKGGAVGSILHFSGREYRVVGVTEEPEASSLFSQGGFENMAFLPFDHVRTVHSRAQINRIFVQIAPDRDPKSLVQAVEATLASRLDKEMYSVLTQQDLLKLVFKVMAILTALLTGLTSIALFVGGVGIMTVMLMSVNERSREIGIRKTVGARRSDIFVQFLGEAVLLALAGGLAGVAVSAAAVQAVSRLTVIKPLLTADVIGLAAAVSIGVGGVFGLIPAMRAAARTPVECLRHE